ncbi:protein-glutamate methylesterase/protein-glutamine glutaminase [Desulfuromonas acetexigens]|uniref:Protein-glutamate methylesterase/protein-glutamine glutaminase n=1 Tax=Trichloromonas acetexigens TaxID=38815 RepID=A0A550JKT0_9BACT|nr:chemotaxis response regulator protein-glutamate methylesterase [Desulfuromonas acetexigens]TRO83828.1 chemotaxis response regulator protein-glutamate methylesterase [Desulfuromonas acetexigens]
MNQTVRVLVIDDSAYNRRTIIKLLEEIPGVTVVGYACNGEEGLRKFFDLQPDLVTLDLEMPRIDGFGFLRIVMQNRPTPVIVISSLADDENVFKAMELGAVDFVAKPTSRISPELVNIRDDLLAKVMETARTDMNKVLRRPSARDRVREAATGPMSTFIPRSNGLGQIVIGASTGGPPALQSLLSSITDPLPLGIAISQHMPPVFTRAFAERLNKFCALEVKEAQTGDLMLPGRVLIAPGGKNLTFQVRAGNVVALVEDPPPNQRYTPSVDVMFKSASDVFGANLLGVVLTGMGNDGARGVERIKEHGGQVLAESEESSIVFGMPKEAIATGKVDKVLPLSLMAGEVLRRCGF